MTHKLIKVHKIPAYLDAKWEFHAQIPVGEKGPKGHQAQLRVQTQWAPALPDLPEDRRYIVADPGRVSPWAWQAVWLSVGDKWFVKKSANPLIVSLLTRFLPEIVSPFEMLKLIDHGGVNHIREKVTGVRVIGWR